MKTSLLKITAPALTISLVFAAPVAFAGNEDGSHESSVTIKEQTQIEKALEPIENNVFGVNDETTAITGHLKSKNTITLEEYLYYDQRLSSLVNRLGEARQDITIISSQYGDGSLHVDGVGVAIAASLAVALDTREQLEAVNIQAETP
ncbi:hypothetical protein QMA09_09345 [Planococcus sp. APC 3906]|uniref:hypothetical protein n=1 Tax=Planococcus sp. APC 3906 TaxID=3035194 RepID=UPI0025B2DF5E|nr:hypothetical protein [Planococcus sp. APC 3906]MDN3450396.1 hypothetical protein [Planococcus sp. APC 3906]